MKDKALVEELQCTVAKVVGKMPTASIPQLIQWTRDHHQPLINKWVNAELADLFEDALQQQKPHADQQKPPIAEPPSQKRDEETPPPPFRHVIELNLPMRSGGRPKYAHPQQDRLPFIENFEQIPFWLYLEPTQRGKTHPKQVALPKATLKDLKRRRSVIRGELSKELPQLNRLISLMEPYDKARPGITVKEALELRATAKKRG